MSELDQQIQELLSETDTKKKKGRRPFGKKKKILFGCGAAMIVLFAGIQMFGGKKETVPAVLTAQLAKGSIQNVLSVSGPVSGTDSVDVVSNLHAEIKSIAVKEGDKVTEGQILAEIDDSDLLKELEIAQNSYDLAVAKKRRDPSGYSECLCQSSTGLPGGPGKLQPAERSGPGRRDFCC